MKANKHLEVARSFTFARAPKSSAAERNALAAAREFIKANLDTKHIKYEQDEYNVGFEIELWSGEHLTGFGQSPEIIPKYWIDLEKDLAEQVENIKLHSRMVRGFADMFQKVAEHGVSYTEFAKHVLAGMVEMKGAK